MLTSLRLCADYSLILVIKPLSRSGNRNQDIPSRFPAGITIYDKFRFVNRMVQEFLPPRAGPHGHTGRKIKKPA